MTSEPPPASLKKSTTPGCAQIGKTFFRKTRLPKFGTSKPRFRPQPSVGCAKIGKTFFGKTRLPKFGTSKPRFRPQPSVGCAQIGKTFFWKTRLPKFGTSKPRFRHPIMHFVARRFLPIFIFRGYESIYGVMTLVPKKFRKTPSARRIFPKVFRRSHFWTYFSCPFS
jgi:hypothetical protein